MAELEDESLKDTEQMKETIKQATYHYFMATMVDINESLMDYNFKVFLEPVRDLAQHDNNQGTMLFNT
jgi:hypothetical protein